MGWCHSDATAPAHRAADAEALERARHDRLEREARGKPDPLDQWPDGLPTDDPDAMKRFEAALRDSCAARGIYGD